MDDGSEPRRNVMLRAAHAFSFCYFFFGRSKEKVDAKRQIEATSCAASSRVDFAPFCLTNERATAVI